MRFNLVTIDTGIRNVKRPCGGLIIDLISRQQKPRTRILLVASDVHVNDLLKPKKTPIDLAADGNLTQCVQ